MKHKTIYQLLSLVLITAAVYAQILWHNFFYHWDDQWVVINSFTESGFTADNLWNVLTTFYHGQYAPMNELSYIVVHSLFGFDAAAFHGASILWHIGNVVLVYLFVAALLPMMGEGLGERKSRTVAWLTALAFAVHPVGVESVAWISASKILVYSFFYLLALNVYLVYVSKPTLWRYGVLAVLFLLSFFGKEQAVVLPLAFLLIDGVTKRMETWRNLVAEKLPFFVMAMFFGIVTILSQGHSPSMPEYGAVARVIYACNALCDYLFRSLLPINLSYIYPFPTQPGDPLPLTLYVYPLLVAGAVVYVYKHRANKMLLFCALFFLIHLLVTVHIISLSRFTLTADRYAYLALAAPSLFLAWLVVTCRDKCSSSKLAVAAYAAYVFSFAAYTVVYTRQWKDSDTLKSHVREVLKERGHLVDKKY